MHLFSKARKQAPAPNPTTTKESIAKLKEALSLLEKRCAVLQNKSDQETQNALALNSRGNKKGALMALKKKRTYTDQVHKILGAQMTLENQIMSIENANVNLEAMNAMKAGASAMKNIHGAMNVDQVDTIMDDIKEQMEVADEVAQAISQPLTMGVDFDEDELNAELDALEQEELDTKLLDTEGVGKMPNLPSPGSTKLPSLKQAAKTPQQTEDEELEALRASMAI